MTQNQNFYELTMDARAVLKKGAKDATLPRSRTTHKYRWKKKGLAPLQQEASCKWGVTHSLVWPHSWGPQTDV